MIPDKATIRIQQFDGVDNRTPETRLPTGGKNRDGSISGALLRQLVNLEVARGKLRLRKGYERVVVVANPHSLWSDGNRAFYAAGSLYGFDGVEATELQGGIAGPVSYETLNGETYWSDGLATGVIQADGSLRAWGLDSPPTPGLAALAYGGLAAGQYQVALTYLMASGEESGAGLAGAIEIGEGGGIAVALPVAVPAEASSVGIYVSEANAMTLRLTTGVFAGQASAVIGVGARGRELKTQFLTKMPSGAIVRAAHGRMWSVSGDLVTYSDPLRYGLTDGRHGWLRWPEAITMFEPNDSGFFIGSATRVAFLQGINPKEFSTVERSNEGAVAPLRIKAPLLGMNGGDIVVWFTSRGWAYGLPDGSVSYPTDKKLALPAYAEGSGVLIEQDGLRQLLAVVRSAESTAAQAMDSVTTEVIRNGQIVN